MHCGSFCNNKCDKVYLKEKPREVIWHDSRTLHSATIPKGLRSLDRKLSERPGHCGHQLWKQLVTLAVLGHYEHTVPWSIMFFGWIFVVFAFCCVCGFFVRRFLGENG